MLEDVKKLMKEDKKTVFNAFVQLFVLMIESDTDNIELTFNFNKCEARFNVDLVEFKELEDKGE